MQTTEQLIDATKRALDRRDAQMLHVPGRIEVFGKHTDYCGGRSLLVATEQGLVFAVAPRDDSIIRVVSVDRNESAEIPISPDLRPTVGHWTNYVMTVVRRLARNFPRAQRGCDIAIAGNLPPAAGMSSSSAMIVGLFMTLDRVNDLRSSAEYHSAIHSREDLCTYLGTIENGSSFRSLAGDRGVGTAGGSQDHTAIVCSLRDRLQQFSFCPVRHERTIDVPSDLCFVVGVSGVVAEKTGAARERYNNVSASARSIVQRFSAQTGRSFDSLADALRSSPDAHEQILATIGDDAPLRSRFEQFVEEAEHLIPRAADAFARRDWTEFGRLADRSQELAESGLLNQIPETTRLQRTARENGALAASAFGAGFGGSVWALVPVGEASAFIQRWRAAAAGTFFVTRAGDGAKWID
ncbi:MAG: galactokinase family protein [Tepidisphaeraceae bacterium]